MIKLSAKALFDWKKRDRKTWGYDNVKDFLNWLNEEIECVTCNNRKFESSYEFVLASFSADLACPMCEGLGKIPHYKLYEVEGDEI